MREDLYMNQIPLYELPEAKNLIAKLNKWSYGLPNSGVEWYRTLKNKLVELGFLQSKLDEGIFYDASSQLIVLVYVDDLMVLCDNVNTIATFKHLISQTFKCKDCGQIKKFLGVDYVYEHSNQKMYMSLKSKIINLYVSNSNSLPKPTKVPLDDKTKFDVESPPATDTYKFRSNVGQLNFITRIRPDIVTYVNRLSQYLKSPTQHHEQLALKVIAYVYNTINYVLIYVGTGVGGLVAYSDSDFVSKNSNDGRSYSGSAVMYCQMPILWASKKQSIIAGDNCQSELYALNFTLNKLLSIFNIMNELNLLGTNDQILQLYIDNRAAQLIAETGLHQNSRHYRISLLYVKDYIDRNQLKINHIKSEDNVSDLYTKLVSNRLFYRFRQILNVVNTHKRESSRLNAGEVVN